MQIISNAVKTNGHSFFYYNTYFLKFQILFHTFYKNMHFTAAAKKIIAQKYGVIGVFINITKNYCKK